MLRRDSGSKPSKEPPAPKQEATEFFALLLNTTTKDEEEEFLDFSFPAGSPGLQAVVPMKGVFLASCGIMKAAVGQQVNFIVFRSLDGRRELKVAMRAVEKWILCVVLPSSTADTVAQFMVDEAIGLIGLRHGRLSSLQGNFRQLDRIFRALSDLWVSSTALMFGIEAHCPDAGSLYMSLRIVLWHPLAEEWRDVVKQRIVAWERGWAASAASPAPLASPKGFALLLEGKLMATCLHESTFVCCLRLLAFEGKLCAHSSTLAAQRPVAVTDSPRNRKDTECKCHSIFLPELDLGTAVAAVLPSHQYSLLQHGPWVLLVLWSMVSGASSAQAPTSSSQPLTLPQAGSGDPFGVDLSLELLEALPLPPGYDPRDAAAAAQSGKFTPVSASSTKSGGKTPGTEKTKRNFGLPCTGSIFKSSSKSKVPATLVQESLAQTSPPQQRPTSFMCSLDLQGQSEAPERPIHSFSQLQAPFQASRPGAQEANLRCPVLAFQARKRKCSDWTSAQASDFLTEWSNLEWLLQCHAARRESWMKVPPRTAKRHVLIDILRGDNSLDKLWDQCIADLDLGDLDQGTDAAAKQGKTTQATLLGSGEPWRFQEGAPYILPDIPPLVSVGSLAAAATGSSKKAWVAASAQLSGERALFAMTEEDTKQVVAIPKPPPKLDNHFASNVVSAPELPIASEVPISAV
eukprot:TRINITY_DN31240_c0_g1_i1.p1 TRINITY_DN31240_c0_g1~~TRINITY_DN31240_c0_g1_i1.p1  ORF type:complete len:687 (-),score=137.43 TRINITY_DN31240_c0_g1_i1:508-2568(-)